MKLKEFFSRFPGKEKLSGCKGRLAGSLFGILAGPFGVALGFLVGYLVDFILASGSIRAQVAVFLRTPEKAALPGNAEGKYSFFCLGAAVCIASGGSLIRKEETLLRRLADFYPFHRREAEYVRALLEEMDGFDAAPDLAAHARELRRLTEETGDAVQTDSRLRELYAGLLCFAEGPAIPSGSPAALILRLVAHIWNTPSGIAESPPSAEDDPWRVLGLPRGADREEVKKVFRMLASQFHPDGGFALSDIQLRQTEEAFRRIRGAYEQVMQEL